MVRSRRVTSSDRPSRAPRWLYLLYLVVWAASSGVVVRTIQVDERANQQATRLAWLFVAVSGVLVLAVINRDAVARRRTDMFLHERQAMIESIGIVTDPQLSQLPLHRLLGELLERARSALSGDTASVFLFEPEYDQLRRSATSGLGDDARRIIVVPRGQGVIGQVADGRKMLVLPDAPRDRALPKGTVSMLVAPLMAEGQLLGVLEVGTTQRREFSDSDLRLMQLVTDRAAVAIDGTRLEREARISALSADAARRRLAMLAEAGDVLARSFENVAAMTQALGDALVPEFVDWFSFYEVDHADAPRLLATTHDEHVRRRGIEQPWTDAMAGAIEGAEPQLIWGERLVQDWPQARARELSSLVVAPMTIGDVVSGAVVLGTAGRRRGLRPGDVSTGVDLAARIAVAVERVRLSGETVSSAMRAARHATQLQRLTEAAFAVNGALSTEALATVVADQAAHVFEAQAAWVELRRVGRRRGRAGRHGTKPAGAPVSSATLTDTEGTDIGSISVARAGAPLGSEEESVLGSLAQIASVALTNARLYGSVQDSETRLRALYDASPVGLVELDTEGSAVRWNRAAEEIFGWAPFEEAKKPRLPMPPAAAAFITEVLTGDVTTACDVTLGDVEIELVAVPLGDLGEPVRGAVLAAVDLTERKHVAEQLQHAQRMEAMARMAGGIAHDFNNVLQVITGYADMLLRRSVDDDIRADVEAMRAAAKRAAEFTRKLLTISRRQLVQAQVVDVAAEFESLRDVLPIMLGDSIEVALLVDDPPNVLIDPAQFEQLVLNLAMNAKDAMPDGGTLSVQAREVVDESGGWAQLTMADTGEGMDPGTVEHCFEPFFTTKERNKGTGLGLSTVYGVVTQAGGDVMVESALGVGTTFTIRLPAASGTVGSVRVPGEQRPLRVLVVDDDADVRAVVADMLEIEGHETVVAADGSAALASLEEADPDVLLTDVVMPGMRGTELAGKVLALMPDISVVLMSSHVDDQEALDDVEGALFLAKPFSPDALLDVLAACPPRVAQGSKR